MAITNHERIGKALDLLKDGLRPVVEGRKKGTGCFSVSYWRAS